MENNVFEQMAKKYDNEERIALAKVIVQEVKPELAGCTGQSMLDYGSGTGLVSLAVADSVGSLLLVDSSRQMLKVAEGKIAQQGITNAKVLYADFTKDLPQLQADVILVSLVLLHIPDTAAILQRLFHILNEGGKLLVVDFDTNEKVSHPKVHSGFAQEELTRLLASVGFQSTEIRTFHHGDRLFMNQDASLFLAKSIK